MDNVNWSRYQDRVLIGQGKKKDRVQIGTIARLDRISHHLVSFHGDLLNATYTNSFWVLQAPIAQLWTSISTRMI